MTKNLQKIRDELAEQSVLTAAYEYRNYHRGVFVSGFDAATELWAKECEKLVEYLGWIHTAYICPTNNEMNDLKFCQTTIKEIGKRAREALAHHQEFLNGKIENE